MLKLAALILFALLPLTSSAYMDQIPEWDSLEVHTVIDGDPVVVSASVTKDRISTLVVTMRGKQVVVASEEFADLIRPRLNTLRLISPDVKSFVGPAVIVEFKVEADSQSLGLALGVARFHFAEFGYVGRDVSFQQLVHETKAPGRPPKRETSQSTGERKP
jgi:hypothetical protein